jgi:hypothetical protein
LELTPSGIIYQNKATSQQRNTKSRKDLQQSYG